MDLVRVFVWQTFSHWLTLMSGGAVIVVLMLWERYHERPIPFGVAARMFAALLVFAMFQTWRDEHVTAVTATAALAHTEQELADARQAGNDKTNLITALEVELHRTPLTVRIDQPPPAASASAPPAAAAPGVARWTITYNGLPVEGQRLAAGINFTLEAFTATNLTGVSTRHAVMVRLHFGLRIGDTLLGGDETHINGWNAVATPDHREPNEYTYSVGRTVVPRESISTPLFSGKFDDWRPGNVDADVQVLDGDAELASAKFVILIPGG